MDGYIELKTRGLCVQTCPPFPPLVGREGEQTAVSTDHLRRGLLPPAHGGAQGSQARERPAGCPHERQDCRLW